MPLDFETVATNARCVGNKVRNLPFIPGQDAEVPLTATWKQGGKSITDSVLVVLQPDASLDLKPSDCMIRTQVRSYKRTDELLQVLKEQSTESLQKLMGLGKKMAKGHLERFQTWGKLPEKQACLLFGGDGLGAVDFNEGDQKFVQAHLRFASGLYGVLRPYDDCKPVRDLPMMAELETKRGETVLEFWEDMISKQLVKDAAAAASGKEGTQVLLISCMSEEYTKVIQPKDFPSSVFVVLCLFEGGPSKALSNVRGEFGRYIIRKRVCTTEGLRDFNPDDWVLDHMRTTNARMVWTYRGDDAESESDRGKETKKGKKDTDKSKGKDKDKGKDKGRSDEDGDKLKGKEKERDREREKEKEKGRDKDREKGKERGRSREREKAKDKQEARGRGKDAEKKRKKRGSSASSRSRVRKSRSRSRSQSASRSPPRKERRR